MRRVALLPGLVVLAIAAALRFSFAVPGIWQQPWTPHHFDEHFLPFEALALWEGVTPREVGWPGSTFRLVLSAAYGVWLILHEGAVLVRAGVADSMVLVARWVGERVGDSAPLFVVGRTLSGIFGLLHVVFAMIAARTLVRSDAALIAGALTAVSPIAVTHSQLVLADVLGAACVTLALAVPTSRARGQRAIALGLLIGLATASKFHFGMWLVPAILSVWLVADDGIVESRRARASAVGSLLLAFSITILALVPWFTINPVLALKEFSTVVLSKAGSGADGASSAVQNLWTVFSGLGLPVLAGTVVGFARAWQRGRRQAAIIAGTTVAAALLLSLSAIVFDRHGLLILPGMTILATSGWLSVLDRFPRVGPAAVVAAILAGGLPQAVQAVVRQGAINSYHAAHAWMIERLPAGASVVVYSEDNQYLPRAAHQLEACSSYARTEEAYLEKWATNGITLSARSGMPMQAAVVADELYLAYWCAREALSVRSPAFLVHRFHAEPRFQTMTTRVMERAFREGLTDDSRGFDAVLVHWNLFPDLQPARTFESSAGPTLRLYLRPGLRLRAALAP